MKRKSPLLPRKATPSVDGTLSPKHLTVHTSASSLLSVSPGTSSLHPSTSGQPTLLNVYSAKDFSSMEEMNEELIVPALYSNGTFDSSSSHQLSVPDETDGGTTPDFQRTRAAIEQVQQKIYHTKELIKAEQTSRDENVNEYLKLAANADKQQLQRIKSVFEKKNQKSAQTISQLQKKLDNYNKRIRDLEAHGLSSSHWQPREVLRDVGHGLKGVGTNIKEGITGFSGGVVGNIKGGLSGLSAATQNAAESVMSKPREFAVLFKNRFGSSEIIGSSEKLEEGHAENGERNLMGSATFTSYTAKYISDDDSSSMTSGSGHINAGSSSASPQHQPMTTLDELSHSHPEISITPTIPAPLVIDLEPILQELRERREECNHMAEVVESLKNQMQQDCSCFHQSLQEERYRFERLEEQMNDLIELHQNEIENLKQGLSDMEEKVQYQSEERLRDVHEVLENCQTRISRMEHQHQHLQQMVNISSLDNSSAHALINVLLAVLQVVLLVVSMAANILMPFIQNRVRILTTTILVLSIIFMCQQWTEVANWGHKFLTKHLQS